MLHLSSASGGAVSAMAADSADASKVAGNGGGYVLTGTLPDGQPDDQHVYKLRTATADDAATVADALGLDGTPTRVDGGWALRDGDNRLLVRDDGGWSYGLDCTPDEPVSKEDVGVACAYAMSSTVAAKPPADAPDAPDAPNATDAEPADGGNVSSDGSIGDHSCVADACTDAACDKDGACTVAPAPPCAAPGTDARGDSTGSAGAADPDACYPIDEPPPSSEPVEPGPSDADARAAAAPVFDALGLGDAAITVWSGDPTSTVMAAPKVDGLATVGWVTSLQIDADGDIQWADGWIDGARAGDAYPVTTAQDAFDALQNAPRPMMEMCMVRKDGKPGCAEMPPTEITGGSLGLMLDYDGTRAVLVPAWLFDVKDMPDPMPQIAIDPSYLAPPDYGQSGVDDGATSGGGSGSSSGSSCGGTDSGPATSGVVEDSTQPTER
jgi:hypothetical protein